MPATDKDHRSDGRFKPFCGATCFCTTNNKLAKDPYHNKMYICDANKNWVCEGRFQPHCGVTCFCTTNIKFAKDPNHPLTYDEYYKEEGARRYLLGGTRNG